MRGTDLTGEPDDEGLADGAWLAEDGWAWPLRSPCTARIWELTAR